MSENIKKIIELMNENNIKKFKFKNKNFLIEIYKDKFKKKRNKNNYNLTNTKIVKSPLSGICHTSPSLNEPNFIKEGDIINDGDILCLIESMKTLHQIKSDSKGIVLKIFINNNKKIDYNEELFLIKNV